MRSRSIGAPARRGAGSRSEATAPGAAAPTTSARWPARTFRRFLVTSIWAAAGAAADMESAPAMSAAREQRSRSQGPPSGLGKTRQATDGRRAVVVSAITRGALTGGSSSHEPATIRRRVQPRPAHRPRRLLPRAREGRRPHARGLGARVRRRPARLRGAARADRAAPAPGPPLPPEARVPAARAGAAGVGRRPALQHRLPRAPHGAARSPPASTSCGGWRAASSPSSSTARSRCGRSGSSTASATTASRWCARRTTRWSTASRASTSWPCCSTSTPTRRSATPARPGTRAPSPAARRCSPTPSTDSPARRCRRPRPPRALLAAPREAAGQAARTLAGLASMAAAGLGGAPESPLNTRIGPHRRFAWVESDLDRFKAVKNALGGTDQRRRARRRSRGALRAHLERRGRDPAGLELKAMVPVSVRAEDQRGALGNQVAAMYAPLPVGLADPLERFRAVQRGARRPQVVGPGDRRRAAHPARRLRGADHPQPGGPAAGAPALLQPHRDQRARAAVPALSSSGAG